MTTVWHSRKKKPAAAGPARMIAGRACEPVAAVPGGKMGRRRSSETGKRSGGGFAGDGSKPLDLIAHAGFGRVRQEVEENRFVAGFDRPGHAVNHATIGVSPFNRDVDRLVQKRAKGFEPSTYSLGS